MGLLKHLTYGPAGAGKTWYAASVFTSAHVDPAKVVYVDNHDSTAVLDLPKYVVGKGGVLHVHYSEPDRIKKLVEQVRAAVRQGEHPFDAIVIDDLSEYDMTDMDVRLENTKDKWAAWGAHLSEFCNVVRMLSPAETGAHLIVVSRAARTPNPLAHKRRDAQGKTIVDDADTIVGPALRGQFGAWVPHFFDLITYQQEEVNSKGEVVHRMVLRTNGNMYIKNRWKHLKEVPALIDDPTFDKVLMMTGGGK